MTRDPVWQDDPPFAGGEAQIAPATDEEIAELEEGMEGQEWGELEFIPSLIARIKAEQEERKGAVADAEKWLSEIARLRNRLDDDIKAEREQTIRECAEIARPLPLSGGSDIEKQAYDIRQVLFNRILSLLQSSKEA